MEYGYLYTRGLEYAVHVWNWSAGRVLEGVLIIQRRHPRLFLRTGMLVALCKVPVLAL